MINIYLFSNMFVYFNLIVTKYYKIFSYDIITITTKINALTKINNIFNYCLSYHYSFQNLIIFIFKVDWQVNYAFKHLFLKAIWHQKLYIVISSLSLNNSINFIMAHFSFTITYFVSGKNLTCFMTVFTF